jgi:hypothetical protein
LLEAEARLDAAVVAARDNAAARVAAARAAADACAAGLADEIAAVHRAEAVRLATNLADREAHLEKAGQAAVARFEQISDREMAGLAAWLVAEVIDPTEAAR